MEDNNLIIITTPKLGIGGIQRATTNLSNWLISKGYEVVLVSCKKENVFYDLDKKVQVKTPDFKYNTKFGKFIYYLKVFKYLREELKNTNSKHIFSFGETFNPIVLLASFGLKKEVFISDRTSPDYNHTLLVNLLRKFTYPYAKALILQSKKSYDYNKNLFGRVEKTIIPNFIHSFDSKIVQRERTILYVGRFAWEKAPERLIRAFSNVRNKNGYKLEMCGDGPMLEDMKNLTENLGIAKDVIFHGKVSNVSFFYDKASIYVLPSVLEGYPNALCEALFSGIASICYDSIPHEDIGVNNVDFLVIGKDFNTLEDALNHLIHNEGERNRLAENATSIKHRLADDSIGKMYVNLISEK
jgi:glycosyltransferase involved in cell wall biosynthesis